MSATGEADAAAKSNKNGTTASGGGTTNTDVEIYSDWLILLDSDRARSVMQGARLLFRYRSPEPALLVHHKASKPGIARMDRSKLSQHLENASRNSRLRSKSCFRRFASSWLFHSKARKNRPILLT